ncbi:hypothetical protein [Streptomyces katsurahamanus]|uniref:Core-binding (CB) domain-containing protein n=1 Tax=Streptomyces katsurahamanus TaxID=2577098 RepID=A0ABW9NU29_9ACTN|nr:hypothetical protein [Streptomyces katsurahamanus]MQS36813.1 hypothetical protein [Streptomyces katsurahamanus]
MSGRGRRAVMPPAGHRTEPPLAADGLVVTVTSKGGSTKRFDFGDLPVAEPMQHSLARAFASQSRGWTSIRTADTYWMTAGMFARFLSWQDSPPDDLDGLTIAMLQSWRKEHVGTNTGKNTLASVRALLRRDSRLVRGPVAEELARRIPTQPPGGQSYEETERNEVMLAAQREFRSAWLRISENARLLNRWRAGEVPRASRDWRLGEVLDHLARTGDVPRTLLPGGQTTVTNHRLLGGKDPTHTWGRLFLTRPELTALAVLMTGRFGWNLAVYDRMPVPTTAPSAGEVDAVTYQVQIEKRRAGIGRWFSTENITDSGADSAGRLITQALEATAQGRELAGRLAPGRDLLMVARAQKPTLQHRDLDRPAPVGPLSFGVSTDMGKWWGKGNGLAGSPFQRSRRTTVTNEGRPLQHTQGTHESVYVLPDKRVQRASRSVFESGANEALEQARTAAFGGRITDTANLEHQETATVNCEDETTSPWPAPEGGCGADFLLCLACPNAHVHPGHHPRLAHLHQQILSLRPALGDRAFRDRWGDHLLRLEDLRDKVGPNAWTAALARVNDLDRTVVQLLVKKDLTP